jgi:hypothetical protein
MNKLFETVNEALTAAYLKNWKVIAIEPFPHPEDSFMIKCVVVNHKNEAVSYVFNRGFQSGYYFDNELDAARHMNNR